MPATTLTSDSTDNVSRPTESQISFARTMGVEMDRLRGTASYTDSWTNRVANCNDRAAASGLIERMIERRDQERRETAARQARSIRLNREGETSTASLTPTIPQGFYALVAEALPAGMHSRQPVRFFAVVQVRSGATRVREVIGGRVDRWFSQPVSDQIIAAISTVGVVSAATLYAQAIGRCYVCNTRLTDAESRRLGIGPDCRGARTARGQAWQSFILNCGVPIPTRTDTIASRQSIRNAVTSSAARIRQEREAQEAGAQARATAAHVPCNCEDCGDLAVGRYVEAEEYSYPAPTGTPLCDECAIDRNWTAVVVFPRQHRPAVSVA